MRIFFVPRKFQEKISNEMLQTLSSLLLGDTVFRIVQHLMDIQHVTEQHLFDKRNALLKTHECKYVNSVFQMTNNSNK